MTLAKAQSSPRQRGDEISSTISLLNRCAAAPLREILLSSNLAGRKMWARSSVLAFRDLRLTSLACCLAGGRHQRRLKRRRGKRRRTRTALPGRSGDVAALAMHSEHRCERSLRECARNLAVSSAFTTSTRLKNRRPGHERCRESYDS